MEMIDAQQLRQGERNPFTVVHDDLANYKSVTDAEPPGRAQ